jgi:hypothetical protein
MARSNALTRLDGKQTTSAIRLRSASRALPTGGLSSDGESAGEGASWRAAWLTDENPRQA